MSDAQREFGDVFDVSVAPDTPMRDSEVEHFRDHLAVMMALRHAHKRARIPDRFATEILDKSWGAVRAYLDAYNPDPKLQENPVVRAVRVMQTDEVYNPVLHFLSQEEWKREAVMIKQAYDGGPYTLVTDGERPREGDR